MNIPYKFQSTSAEYLNMESIGPGYIYNTPFVYPAFAEYTEQPTLEETDGVVDTGLCMRAFLPLELQPTRELTQSYSEKASVVDSRVICMRPVLSMISLTINSIEGRYRTDLSTTLFDSENQGPLMPVSAQVNSSTFLNSTAFKCALPVFESGAGGWLVSVCHSQRTSAGIVSPMLLPDSLHRTETERHILLSI
jgi:hypothetical protein